MIVRVLTKLKISLSPRATLNLPDPLPIRPCIILIIPPHRQSIFYSPLFKLCWRRLIPPPPPGSLWKPCDPPQNPRLAPLLPLALNNDFSLTGAFLLSWCCVRHRTSISRLFCYLRLWMTPSCCDSRCSYAYKILFGYLCWFFDLTFWLRFFLKWLEFQISNEPRLEFTYRNHLIQTMYFAYFHPIIVVEIICLDVALQIPDCRIFLIIVSNIIVCM